MLENGVGSPGAGVTVNRLTQVLKSHLGLGRAAVFSLSSLFLSDGLNKLPLVP